MRLQNALNTLLSSVSTYGEYGAGETTLFAATKQNLKEIHSVESDKGWIEDLKGKLIRSTDVPVNFHHKEMGTAYMSWGHPGKAATESQKRAYSDAIPSLAPIDVLLVDGRFRVACALKAHGWLSDTATLVFDDFWIRPQYHVVLEYFDMIERIDTIAILRRKPHTSVPSELIRQYELVVD